MSTSSGIDHLDLKQATSAGSPEGSARGTLRAPILFSLCSEDGVEIIQVSLRL